MEPKYKFNPLTGELQEYYFEYNGILALRNFTAKVEDERLILHAADDVNFSILEALVSEVEINGVVYDNPTAAQEALTRLTFNQNRPVLLDKSLKDLILGAVQKIPGKKLSTEDFTTELRQKLEGLQQVDTSSLLPKGGYTGTAQDLKNLIDNINRILQSDDTDLDQLQEIVNYIKQNKHILSTLGINNIAGLADALAAKADKNHHHDERYAPITHHHNEYAHRTHRHNWDDIDGKPNNLATTESVKTAVEGIQIGGRNLIRGTANFETKSEPYFLQQNYAGNAGFVNETFRGNKVIKLIYNWQGFQCRTTFEKRPMIISFWAKTTKPNIQFIYIVGESVITYPDGDKLIPDGQWHRYTIYGSNGIATYDKESHGFLEFNSMTGGHIEEVYVSSFKIEYGNTPTDWSPAFEDLEDLTNQKISEIQVGGRNYILNSKNERYKEYQGTVEDYIIYNIVGGTLEKNTTYTLTLEYKSENVRSVDLFFINSGISQTHNKNVPNTNGEWRKETFTFTTSPTLTAEGYIRIDNNGSELGDVMSKLWTRLVKLEKGKLTTDWSPAPEDLALYEDLIRVGSLITGDVSLNKNHRNSIFFVTANANIDVRELDLLGSSSFRKVFDGGAVTFTCAGKNIIYTGDNTFNGKKGSTAVVSIYDNDCYIDIRNI